MNRNRLLLILPFVAALVPLLAAYLLTLQTIPNGSEHYYMIDVGETQVVLNVWGTLHSTGYPLYVMTGSAAVALLRGLGVEAVVAPALVSLLWGMGALLLVYTLVYALTRQPLLAAALVVAFGLTRTVWIHQVIAEIYAMGLAILIGLLLIALWTPPIRGRLYWLALLGGIGVAHHRAIAMVAPALLLAVLPDLLSEPRSLPRRLLVCLLLGLVGFLPYLYLPLREWSGASWVYGEPGTLQGLWDQFSGREASRFIGTPPTFEGLIGNFNLINSVIITDITLPGVVVGLVGLGIGVRTHPRAALTLILSGAVAYGFHVLFYTDVLSALILPVTLSLAFGWLFAGEAILNVKTEGREGARGFILKAFAPLSLCAFALTLFASNFDFIRANTRDDTGLESIAIARAAPPDSTLMIAWGVRHFAVGFAKDVMGELPHITLVDHKADYRTARTLVTPDYTFYNFPQVWWEEQLGAPVYLRAAAPYLVEIDTEPQHRSASPQALPPFPIIDESVEVRCEGEGVVLVINWWARGAPQQDWGAFVHVLDANGNVIAQGDFATRVYGWRPVITWQEGEIVRDMIPLPYLPAAALIRFGLYEQRADGSFHNVFENDIPAPECEA